MGLDLVNVLANCMGYTVPAAVFNLTALIIKIIQVVVPILLIIWGMLDFAKAVMGGDEDKIKAGQKTFIQRLIAAIIVFLVVVIVKLIVGIAAGVAGDDTEAGDENFTSCMNQFIKGVSTDSTDSSDQPKE